MGSTDRCTQRAALSSYGLTDNDRAVFTSPPTAPAFLPPSPAWFYAWRQIWEEALHLTFRFAQSRRLAEEQYQIGREIKSTFFRMEKWWHCVGPGNAAWGGSSEMRLRNRFVSFYPRKSISILTVIFSSLTKSGFCCMRRRVPSPWASAVWHGGQPSCFPGFVRNTLLAGHVLATAPRAPVEAGSASQHLSGRISHPTRRWAEHLLALIRGCWRWSHPNSPTSGRKWAVSGKVWSV